MKRPALLLAAMLATAPTHVFAQNGPLRFPGDRCKEMAVPSDHRVVLTPAQEKSVRCFFEAGNNDAGIRLVQSMMVQIPPDNEGAIKILKIMSNGTKTDGSSLGARSLWAKPKTLANVGQNLDSTLPIVREASPLAQRILAQMLLVGKGTKADPDKAHSWIIKAEKGGDAVAKELRREWIAKGLIKE